ncbi:MAG: hypothetical protein BWY79_00802 [Actinobacteria bacterium ADurb.Bin444]|nr:MAG: hypothetical protein BWY79_00802 [Actinobacteria bacterium ADurb.Bin444]
MVATRLAFGRIGARYENLEQVDKKLRRLRRTLLRGFGPVGIYLKDEFVIVGALPHTRLLHPVCHPRHRGKDGVDRDPINDRLPGLIVVGGRITYAASYPKYHVEPSAFFKRCDLRLGVDDD